MWVKVSDFVFFLTNKMSDKPSPPKRGRSARSANPKGSSEPQLFSSPIVLSAKDKGKALLGVIGGNVLAKRSGQHTVSLLSGRTATASGASTPVSANSNANKEGIESGNTAGVSKTSGSAGSGHSTRAPPAAAGGESRRAPASLTALLHDSSKKSKLSGDSSSAPPSTIGDKVVPVQRSQRSHASPAPSPVAPSSSPNAQRMDRLEQLIYLLMDERAGRVSGSGVTASDSGLAPSGPGISGSGSGNTGFGSGTAASGSGISGADSSVTRSASGDVTSGFTSSGPGISGSGPRISGSGVTGKGSITTGSGSGDVASGGATSGPGTSGSGRRTSGSGVTGTDPPTGAAGTSGSISGSGLARMQPALDGDFAAEQNQVFLSESSEEDNPQMDLGPPPLSREVNRKFTDRSDPLLQQPGTSAEGQELTEDDPSQDSEGALLLAGLAAVGSIDKKYVVETVLPKRPGCLGTSGSGAHLHRYAPSGLVPSWTNYHLNVLRGVRDLGADDWTPEVRPFAEWQPAPVSAVPVVKKLWRPMRPLVLDPALPLPATATETERALVPPQRRYKVPSIPETKVLHVESKMHTAAEALGVASTLVSALSDAIRDPDDSDQLRNDFSVDSVLTTLEAIPAALSYAANALAGAMVCSQVARRDNVLDRSDLPKATTSRLRLVPPAPGSLFGPHLETLRNTEIRTPLSVDDLTKAFQASAAAPRKHKPSPAATGWGGRRDRKRKANLPAADAPPFKKGKGSFRQGPPSRGKGRGRRPN